MAESLLALLVAGVLVAWVVAFVVGWRLAGWWMGDEFKDV